MSRKLTRFLLICCIGLYTTVSFAHEKLIFAIDLIRHGDRTPMAELSKNPHDWPQGLGELTGEGMQQEYQLGVRFRQRYIAEYQLLPPRYVSELIYARASDINRTIMSAECVFLGLYPLGTGASLSESYDFALPEGYQPVPIHTVPYGQDDLINPKEDRKSAYLQKNWQDKTKTLESKFVHWSQVTGANITNLTQLKSIGDTLYIRRLHRIPLPKGLTQNDANQIVSAGQWALVNEYKTPSDAGQHLIATVAEYFQKAIDHKSKLKYVLLSGHDSTILRAMRALGVPLDAVPDYSSDLNFLLFENDAKKYVIKIRYNDKPIKLPVCNREECTLEQFKQLLTEPRPSGSVSGVHNTP